MSLEDQNPPAQNALENEQRFVLDTKEGLQKFHEFLVSEERQIDALDPDLTIEDLALPATVAASLTQLRFEYKELVRLTNEALQTETEELHENSVVSIADQYQVYIGADERFSLAYVAYEAAQEDSMFSRSEVVIEKIQSPLQEEISAHYVSIKKTYDTFCQKFPKAERSAEIENVVDTLRDAHARAAVVQHQATKNDELNPVPSAEDLRNYVRSIERIRTSIDTLVSSVDDGLVEHVVSEEPAPLEVKLQPESNSEQLRVCGMSLPEAGPSGVLAARSFRNNLEVAKHNHPDLKDNPKNLAVANSISRVLFVVPAVGLTETQVSRVAELAGELNLSGEATEATEMNESAAQEERNMVGSDEETGVKEEAPAGSPDIGFDDAEAGLVNKNTKRSGAMKVEPGAEDDGVVKITFVQKVAKQAERKIALTDDNLTDDSVLDAIDQLTRSREGSGVVAEMEKEDSVNSIYNSIPPQVTRDSVKREAVSNNSLTGKYLASNPQYQVFFQENNISLAGFEKKLQRTIESIDAKEIDFWESKFDEPYESAFSYLQGMTLQEIEDLNALSPVERKNLLQAENVKYEAYLTWMDTYEFMTQTTTPQPAMRFAEIFAKWMVETEMTDYQKVIPASQFTL